MEDVNLVLFKNNGVQKSFSLPSTASVIGRRDDCDLCIPLMDVSRRHCQLNINDQSLQVRDLGSRNGTYINGKPVNGETMVKAGDYLQVGPLVFQFQIDGEPQQAAPPPADKIQTTPASPALPRTEEDDDLIDLDIDMDGSDAFLDGLDDE